MSHFVRALGVPAMCAVALVLGACTGGDDGALQDPASPTPSSSEPAEEQARQDLITKRLVDLPRLDPSLPRSIPETLRGDSVLVSPPGRTRLVFHPLERHDDPHGWVGEELLFLGVDGEWSSLRMADLGLPDSAWPGVDTYGPGKLSPNGLWWATHTNDGVVLMDLRTGEWDLLDVGFAVSPVVWTPDSSRVLATKWGNAPTAVIEVSSGRVSFAEHNLALAMEPPRTPALMRRHKGEAVLVRYDLTGKVISRRPVPDEWVEGYARLRPILGEGRFAIPRTQSPPGLTDMLVVDTDSLEPRALLRMRDGHERWLDTYGWDPRGRLLIGVDSGVMAWDPGTGEQFEVIRSRGPMIPVSPGTPALAWTITLATDTFN